MGTRERLGLNDILLVLQQDTDAHMGTCFEKKTVIGQRNVWSMKWRVPGQEVDQRKLGRVCGKRLSGK